MKIYKSKHKNEDGFFIENNYIKLCIFPSIGAKIASIIYKPQNFEILYQPKRGLYHKPTYGEEFVKGGVSGLDEMFPTIDPCKYNFENKNIQIPDHGEVWSMNWDFRLLANKIETSVKSKKFNYFMKREVSLNENIINFFYEITNTGKAPFSGLWASHGLLACDEWSILNLPKPNEVINVHKSKYLGKSGTIHKFPLTRDKKGNNYNLCSIKPKSYQKTEKFYINGKVEKGLASITLNKNKLECIYKFEEDVIPYLGIWICEGGLENAHMCAIEPSTGFYDSLETAQKLGGLKNLKYYESFSWTMQIELNKKDIVGRY